MQIFLGFKNHRNVSYTGHAFGGLAGLLVGGVLLENRRVEQWEERAKAIAFVIFYALMVSLVLWHVIGTFADWGFPDYGAIRRRSDEGI